MLLLAREHHKVRKETMIVKPIPGKHVVKREKEKEKVERDTSASGLETTGERGYTRREEGKWIRRSSK